MFNISFRRPVQWQWANPGNLRNNELMNKDFCWATEKETMNYFPSQGPPTRDAWCILSNSKWGHSLSPLHHYPHDEAGVGDLVVVSGVAVHQLDIEWELGQGDVGVNIVMGGTHPLHLDLDNNDEGESVMKSCLPVCWRSQMIQTWPHSIVRLPGTCGSPCCKPRHNLSWSILAVLWWSNVDYWWSGV